MKTESENVGINSGKVKPIFILSLPRAGSTLLQRLLSCYPEIGTTSETWLLLPLLSVFYNKKTYSEYGFYMMHSAILEFIGKLPGGRRQYLAEVERFAIRLFEGQSRQGVKYFIDKTPRYHLILPELIETFPDAKFIFLWRNPLGLISSMLETFCENKWKLYYFYIDLFKGFENLISAFNQIQYKAHAVKFESLISDPEYELRKICDFIEIEFDSQCIERGAAVRIDGRMGDPSGQYLYSSLSAEPVQKWKKQLRSPLRKYWCRRYLHWIGSNRLKVMGYSLDEILAELNSLPGSLKESIPDGCRMIYGVLHRSLEPRLFLEKTRSWRRGEKAYSHE